MGGGGAPSAPGGNGGGQAPSAQPGMTQDKQQSNKQPKAQQMKLKISPVTLLQLGAFGFTIIAFAVLLASMNILRLEPRKILIG